MTIDLRLFNEKFISGLIFSIIEGLEEGNRVVFQSNKSFKNVQEQLASLALQNIECVENFKNEIYELMVLKNKSNSHDNCCGICGSHGN